jgi:hypothetical protein
LKDSGFGRLLLASLLPLPGVRTQSLSDTRTTLEVTSSHENPTIGRSRKVLCYYERKSLSTREVLALKFGVLFNRKSENANFRAFQIFPEVWEYTSLLLCKYFTTFGNIQVSRFHNMPRSLRIFKSPTFQISRESLEDSNFTRPNCSMKSGKIQQIGNVTCCTVR